MWTTLINQNCFAFLIVSIKTIFPILFEAVLVISKKVSVNCYWKANFDLDCEWARNHPDSENCHLRTDNPFPWRHFSDQNNRILPTDRVEWKSSLNRMRKTFDENLKAKNCLKDCVCVLFVRLFIQLKTKLWSSFCKQNIFKNKFVCWCTFMIFLNQA